MPSLKETVKHGKDSAETNNIRMAKLQIERFEQKKISDAKVLHFLMRLLIHNHRFQKLLEEFVKIELAFHTKAIDMLSLAFNGLLAIDARSDMISFRKAFDFPLPETTPGTKNVTSQSNLRRFSSTPEISGQLGGQPKVRAYESDDDIGSESAEISIKKKPATRKSSKI